MQADELLRAGRLEEALAALEGQVRSDPADAKLRGFSCSSSWPLWETGSEL
jgi:protein involved in temperature-dependent protein secretion